MQSADGFVLTLEDGLFAFANRGTVLINNQFGLEVTCWSRSTSYSMQGMVNTWMDDHVYVQVCHLSM